MAIQRFVIEMRVDVTGDGRSALEQMAREQAIALRNAAVFISSGRYKLSVGLTVYDNYANSTQISLEEPGAPEVGEGGEP